MEPYKLVKRDWQQPLLACNRNFAAAQCQALKSAVCHSLQALVKTVSKCQALKIAWQGHSLQPLVETVSKCQALKAAWQHHSLQALDKFLAKCQALKTVWQGHFLLYLLSWSPLLVQSFRQRLGFRTRSTMQHRGLLDFVGTYVHESVAASPTILCCNVCCSVGESW